MKRSTVLAGAALVGVLALANTSAAFAGTKSHVAGHDQARVRKADSHVDGHKHRDARVRKAQTPTPTATPTLTPTATASPTTTSHQGTHQMACTVTIDKLSGFQGAAVTNTAVVKGCRTPQPITSSVQVYPLDHYVAGTCEATGKCRHVGTYPATLPIGTSQFTVPLPTDCGLFLQVDHKDAKGRLIRAEHLSTKPCVDPTPTPTPVPPVVHNPTPTPPATVVVHHATPTAQLTALPRTGGLYLFGVALAVVLIGGGLIALLVWFLLAPERRWMRARKAAA